MAKEKGLLLFIEDEPAICDYMEVIFTSEGFKVASAENGKSALELMKSMDPLPKLIFLDLMMPTMDGKRFLFELQNNPDYSRLKDIPIVIVTAAAENVVGNIVEVVSKPPNLDRLIELAEKYAG
jgi:CheY-like chemotaxis protein